ncbi:subclass B3 metallo-beta-lactamase [uncultured Sphingomonas sp.]|uniref:subclass B3 metallo-beta-lactamase n=1 Tax=uncultured Sphingomonas sp. TaxID=158754 RepID=UPI0035CA7716
MSARLAAAVLAALATGCATTPRVPVLGQVLGQVPDQVASPATLAEHGRQCAGKDGWSDPAPPVRVAADLFLVGTCGITVLLLTSPAGHVLIDGATAQAAPGVAANVERLGYRMADVRLILAGHEHLDHAGGLAELQRRSSARLLARTEAGRPLSTGLADPADPQYGTNAPFPGARVDRLVRDGEVVRLGPLALTAHATPGHTPGSTSWTWRSCEAGACRSFAYADSLTAISADGYRFGDHPAYVAAFRATLDKVARLPCDVILTPHPSASRLFERLGGEAPLAEPGGCVRYAATARARLDARLAEERR